MAKDKEEEHANYWIEFCYEELEGSAGLTEGFKSFKEGYFIVKRIVQEHFESRRKKEKRLPLLGG